MRIVCNLLLLAMSVAATLNAEVISRQRVTFTTPDTAHIVGDLYGESDRCVVLAHGAQFNKQSWEPQARQIAAAGFCVLAIDFRGYGDSHGPGEDQSFKTQLYQDVLGAVRYLQKQRGKKSVSVIGADMGGAAAARASMESNEGEIDRLILLAADIDPEVQEHLKGRKLFVVARNDMRGDSFALLEEVRAQYHRAPLPKQLLVVEGSAHAQFLFDTDQADRLMQEILKFLSTP